MAFRISRPKASAKVAEFSADDSHSAEKATVPSPLRVIVGTDGNDRLSGTLGNDTFIDSLGNDTYHGGSGIDTLVYDGGIADYEISYHARFHRFEITHRNGASAGDVDQFLGIEKIGFGRTSDPMFLADIAKTVRGTNGKDVIRLDRLIGVGPRFGIGKVDAVRGYAGDDFLEGSSRDEVLDGGAGDDMLDGGKGSDTLIGGEGNDTAFYRGGLQRYDILRDGNSYLVKDTATGAIDTLHGVETIRLSGRFYRLDELVDPPPADPVDPRPQLVLFDEATGEVAFGRYHAAERLEKTQTVEVLGSGWSAHAGDFDGDGRTDLFLRNGQTGENTLVTLDASGSLVNKRSAASMNASYHVEATGDFDGDKRTDILWKHNGFASGPYDFSSACRLDLMDDGSVKSSWQFHVNLARYNTFSADFNRDGTDDILWHDDQYRYPAIWQMQNGMPSRYVNSWQDNHQTLGEVLPWIWKLEGVGDFDGNGSQDVVWRDKTSGETQIWTIREDYTPAKTTVGTIAGNWIASVHDLNGDGRDDLLWRNTETGDHELWTANERNEFTQLSTGGVSATTQVIAVQSA